MKLSDIFTVAEWTKQLLLAFVYHVHIKLIAYSNFICATDDFQNSRENAIFENCVKTLSFEKFQMFDVFFKMARLVRSRLHFNSIKHFTQKPCFFRDVEFCLFSPKNEKLKENFSKTPLNFCLFKCTNLGKNSFQYHQRLFRK